MNFELKKAPLIQEAEEGLLIIKLVFVFNTLFHYLFSNHDLNYLILFVQY